VGSISAQRGGTGGASKALSNLANVAINASLVPDGDGTRDLGSSSAAWGNAYVNGFVANVVTKTGTYTAAVSDYVILCDASGGAFTVTLPAASGVTGLVLHVKKTDSSGSAVTIDGNSTETIDGDQTIDLLLQYESVTLVSDGTSWHIL
jgi:hypothetical protein